MSAARIRRGAAASARSLLAVLFAQVFDRHHALAFRGVEYDHPLRAAAGDADAVDRAADQLPAVGHQHDLVGFLEREGGDDAAVAGGHRHGDDAFAAAPGGAVFVGRRALAVAALAYREHELLRRRHFHVAL